VRRGTVQSNAGSEVAWRVVGEGKPTVTLIMGLGCSSGFFFDLPERVVERHGGAVLLVDNRGTGGSEVPRRPYKMRDLADDVWRAADAAGADELIVVGSSMGGMIAQYVALEAPERVPALGLLCTSPGWPRFKAPPRSTWRALWAKPFGLDEPRPELLRDVMLSPQEKPRAEEIFARWPEVWQERALPRAATLQIGAIATHAAWRLLPKLEMPVELVHGTADPLVPFDNSVRLARRLKRANLTPVEGAGHALVHVEPESILAGIERLHGRVG
jgi:pimeloyl-ACP methyl ester carboxylesterase